MQTHTQLWSFQFLPGTGIPACGVAAVGAPSSVESCVTPEGLKSEPAPPLGVLECGPSFLVLFDDLLVFIARTVSITRAVCSLQRKKNNNFNYVDEDTLRNQLQRNKGKRKVFCLTKGFLWWLHWLYYNVQLSMVQEQASVLKHRSVTFCALSPLRHRTT